MLTVSAKDYAHEKLNPDTLMQLKNIKRRLNAGEGKTMQAFFPEGWFFSHIVYGYSWVNVALSTKSEPLRQQAIQEVRWVLSQIDTPEGRAPFTADTQVSHGVFYLGWSNRLLGGLLKIQLAKERSPQDITRFHTQSQELAQAFATSPTATIDAYPGQAWPCDQTVALASLALHNELFGSNYQSVIQRWISYTRQHLDPQTGLIPHKIDATTGQIDIGARGTSQVYLLPFLVELDSEFAKQQYAQFGKQFVPSVLGFFIVREYPISTDGDADVDSGPIIFGIGPTSTIVSIAPARAYKDSQLFESTLLITEILGLPLVWGEEKSYALGLLLVIDDFLVWGKTLVPWTQVNYSSSTEQTFAKNIQLWVLFSGLVLLVLWSPVAGKQISKKLR
ncbi:hypothetical protein [Nostoc sp. 106C]|uniref:hypothetical protein n=1 Tax=Nostoc sp. 106C TaxID=1932667 RepID=UPI001412EFEC|nr:hypothetical protein [Nostoc sp. 106C]